MQIDKELCIGCEECQPYCPVGAISSVEWEGNSVSEIDQDACVECGVCLQRARICPTDAIFMPELAWPRSVREPFSNPHIRHPSTDEQGRGTGEMKTNDVTGRFPTGVAGVAVEMGRPGVSASFRDIQIMAAALAGAGVEFEPENPVTALMADRETGLLRPEILDERVLSAIIEFRVDLPELERVLRVIREAAPRINTVFSLDLISRFNPEGGIPTAPVAASAGFTIRPNAKINLGLGRPRAKEI